MSRSAGTGSPVYFHCHRYRQLNYKTRNNPHDRDEHTVTLTGRTKPYKVSKHRALGSRSTRTLREYKCSCGHVGWSNHIDLAVMAGDA